MSNVSTAQLDLAQQTYGPIVGNRWIQLAAGVMAMVVISNFQYAFTLFTPGLKQQFSTAPYSEIALIYTLFILFETWPVPLAGYLIDKFGIRRLMLVGATLIFLGWVLGGMFATSLFQLYIYYGVLAGTGCGIIYVATVANAVKWFPDKRGLAAGLTAAGFGGGSALTLIPISGTIASMGWAGAMTSWGIGQGVVAMAMAMILHHPPKGWLPQDLGAAQGSRANAQGIFRDADDVAERVLHHVCDVPDGLHRRIDDHGEHVADREIAQRTTRLSWVLRLSRSLQPWPA